LLLATEGALVTITGAVVGATTCFVAITLLSGWVRSHFGIDLRSRWPGEIEWMLFAAILGAGWVASLLPGVRAYRLSLADGLSPRV
jgi:putative ABC transport system permease protein